MIARAREAARAALQKLSKQMARTLRVDPAFYDLEFEPLTLREVEVSRAATAPLRKQAEAEALLAGMADGAVLVALDERGRDLASTELAQRLGTWRDEGIREAGFVIGGPDGLAPAITERADLLLAFGRATWPHMLVRAMLAEQLYRAASILAGHPYHRA